MSKRARKIALEMTEEQRLQHELAKRELELNTAKRCTVERDINFYQLTLTLAQSLIPRLQQDIEQFQNEDQQSTQRLLELIKRTKAENGWPDSAQFDLTTVSYSAPAEKEWTAVPETTMESKIRIQ